MSEEILDIVDRYGDITVPGIMSRLRSSGYEPAGTMNIKLSDVENVYIWMEVSAEFTNSLNEMMTKGVIVASRCNVMIYMMDGDPILDMPVAGNKIPKNGYKKPRWVPLTYEINKKKRK